MVCFFGAGGVCCFVLRDDFGRMFYFIGYGKVLAVFFCMLLFCAMFCYVRVLRVFGCARWYVGDCTIAVLLYSSFFGVDGTPKLVGACGSFTFVMLY